ncbi:unnamed protein product [Peniophora sp. CBMAI 1063]|nr:unnamed protein product [Peniophora sp. CBMAI 1063]
MQTATRLVSCRRAPTFIHRSATASTIPFRTMSSGAANLTAPTTPSVKHKFVVWAPDQADALTRRLSVRSSHLETAGKLKQDGILLYGGAMLTPESVAAIQPSEKKMTGSMLLFEAESIDTVRELVEKDVYYVNNVWDTQKIVIAPFVGAMPWPAN